MRSHLSKPVMTLLGSISLQLIGIGTSPANRSFSLEEVIYAPR